MNFYLDELTLNKSSIILNSDYSFKTVNDEVWDFQISIEPYTLLLLNFNYEYKLCTGIEGYLNLYKCKHKKINLNIKKKGILKVENFIVPKDAFGITYTLSDNKCYFDNNEKIFGLGRIDDINEVFEMGIGQYVTIKNGQIIALFIKF